MKVDIWRIDDNPLRIEPASRTRPWMDETPNKYAYRCLPMTIANSTGWDLFATDDFVVSWNGSAHQDDLQINFASNNTHPFITSSFGSGIITVHTGVLFRTDREWDMMVMGSPNHIVEWATPLAGIVETWWNDFTFTMNWKLHQAGSFTWDKNIPLCRVLPIPHDYDNIEISMNAIELNPVQHDRYKEWERSRCEIIDEIDAAYKFGVDGNRVKVGKPKTEWERNYYSGVRKDGERIENHTIKREFPRFVWKK